MHRIIVESGNRIVAIYYDDIQYIHTDKNYIVIHGREEYKIRSTFKDFIKKIKKMILLQFLMESL